MKSMTTCNYDLMTSLGKLKHESHRRWKWYQDPKHNLMYHGNNKTRVVYEQKQGSRSGTWSKLEKKGDRIDRVPMSIKSTSHINISIRATKKWGETKDKISTVWELLDSWGGEWMRK